MSSDGNQVGFLSGNGASGFVQNGQVDWVNFGKTVYHVSSTTLQRFASAGVQPITLGAGAVLASQFELDRVGKQRMHNALKNLQGVWGLENFLFFGFGVQSFVRVMSDSQLGVNCIAMCSALCEVHDVHVAAWILEELWKLYEFPQQYLPSHSQFVALVKACSGVLMKTSFGRTADRMLGEAYDVGDPIPFVANIEDIAKTVRSIFQISTKKVARISVFGGYECGYIAALAHWLFNLKIYVEDESGAVIYQDAIPRQLKSWWRTGSQNRIRLFTFQVPYMSFVS